MNFIQIFNEVCAGLNTRYIELVLIDGEDELSVAMELYWTNGCSRIRLYNSVFDDCGNSIEPIVNTCKNNLLLACEDMKRMVK